MTNRTFVLRAEPGIARDGTDFAKRSWINGQWVRFQRGLPRKIGGYIELLNNLPNIPRRIFILPNPPNLNVYIADFQSVKYLTINQFGIPTSTALVDRTPALFNGNANNNWDFDTLFSATNNSSTLIAHAAPSLSSIDDTTEAPIYYGDALATTPLIPTGISVSGGTVSLYPYLFMYGNDGHVIISEPNDPTTIFESVRVTGSKIVAGLQTRGGNTSPAGLLWSLDSVIRITNVGVDFSFDTVTSQSSILSSRGIIEYDGLFYWAGLDKFLVYNGTVQELPNNLSTNFFFQNINYAQRQKVWVTKNTHFGEIWWHFCNGNVTETNWAVVYNVRERTWYDTPVNRGDGYYTQVFTNPIWSGNTLNNVGHYSLWIHEEGYDEVLLDNTIVTIESNIQTPYFSLCANGIDGSQNGIDKDTYLYRIEPDFNQVGEMTLVVSGKQYANSPVMTSAANPYIFEQDTTKIDMREQAREISLTFSSNAPGGFYEMGQILVVIKSGDDRP